MEGLGLLFLMIGIAAAHMPAVLKQWRTDRPGFNKTLRLAGAYVLYVALGIAGLLLFIRGKEGQSEPERAALLLTGAITAWIFYGGLILVRAVPRYREPPAWLMRFGVADVVLLAVLFGCLGAYLWM
jgi:hypothetical protein